MQPLLNSPASRETIMLEDQQAWGGALRLPRWLRRKPQPTDTPERIAERRRPAPAPRSVLANVDRAVGGAWLFYDLPR
jgi:hypothetical protein